VVADKLCPRNHPLLSMKERNKGGYGCDVCSKGIPPYTEVFGCRECDYDLCVPCFDKAKVVDKA